MSGAFARWVPYCTALLIAAPAGAQVAPVRPAAADPAPADPQAPPLPDAAFDAELPPLEDTAAPPAPAAAPAPTEDPAATADLAQPLPPLATFDPAPEPPTATQAAQSDVPRELRYKTNVAGLDTIGLESRFRDLSTLVEDGNKAANIVQLNARAKSDVALAERLLRSEGYYDGLASAAVPPVAGSEGTLAVTITATPGARYLFGAVTLTGLTPPTEPIARDALQLKIGDPIVATAVEDGEARIALRFPEQGYPFVAVGARDILLDPATHVGDYTLPVDAGPKATFGALRTDGDPVFALDHLRVFPRFKVGEVYDSRRVDDMRQALVATSLFTTIAIEPVRTGQVDADGTETVDLLIHQAKGPARALAANAGYGTGEGVKLQGSWEHRNLFAPEGALVASAILGTQQQSLAGSFRRSNAGQRDRTFALSAAIDRQRYDAYDAETITLGGSLSRASTPIWQKRWTYSLGAELLASRENQSDVTTATRATYFIASLPLQLGYDRSDSLLDPTRGFRLGLRLSPEAQKQSGGGYDIYSRTILGASGYFRLGGSFVLAGRTRVGTIAGVARDDVAPSRRLYAGGGGSVRGFGYQQLGPKDASGDPIGGRSLTEFALEARYRFGNFGIVPFIDAGQVGEGVTPTVSGLRVGAGIGGRYYTNFGPFRIDVATPIARQKGESKLAVYLSIGQAF